MAGKISYVLAYNSGNNLITIKANNAIELDNYAIQEDQIKTYQGKLDIGHLYEFLKVLRTQICKRNEYVNFIPVLQKALGSVYLQEPQS